VYEVGSVATPTITVEPINGYDILQMTWGPQVEEHDIAVAFRTIASFLKQSTQRIDVIVDISSNPHFPMQTVISETLGGPFNHPQMGMWVVVGVSRAAHIVANVLSRLGSRDRVFRFATQQEALSYLAVPHDLRRN